MTCCLKSLKSWFSHAFFWYAFGNHLNWSLRMLHFFIPSFQCLDLNIFSLSMIWDLMIAFRWSWQAVKLIWHTRRMKTWACGNIIFKYIDDTDILPRQDDTSLSHSPLETITQPRHQSNLLQRHCGRCRTCRILPAHVAIQWWLRRHYKLLKTYQPDAM